MMRNQFLIAAASVAALAASVPAQQPKANTPRTPDERTVLALEDAWAKAVVNRDGATFKRLLAPGFVYTEDARVMSGEELTREVTAGSDTVTEARNEELRTHAFGSTMIVTGWLVLRGRSGGKPFDRRFRFTDTWLKRNGEWQIIAAQDYLVPAGRR
jgi:ketosteroid isomerase-like protein